MSCELDSQKSGGLVCGNKSHRDVYQYWTAWLNISFFQAQSPSASAKIRQALLYCAKDAEWAQDLDNKDPLTKLGNPMDRQKCCGEKYDWPNESYQTQIHLTIKTMKAGMFQKQIRGEWIYREQHKRSVLTILNQFFGCQLNETNPNLLTMKDSHNGKPLINDTNRCTLAYNATRAVNVNYYCSFNGTWTLTTKQNKLKPKYVIK